MAKNNSTTHALMLLITIVVISSCASVELDGNIHEFPSKSKRLRECIAKCNHRYLRLPSTSYSEKIEKLSNCIRECYATYYNVGVYYYMRIYRRRADEITL
ncbi:hypothetical protein HN51_044710 [Arachis hypogaea]|nr:uncharacterized protein DS421_18g623090 [Arachis hypogaea]